MEEKSAVILRKTFEKGFKLPPIVKDYPNVDKEERQKLYEQLFANESVKKEGSHAEEG